MSIFEYLDKRNKRQHISNEIKKLREYLQVEDRKIMVLGDMGWTESQITRHYNRIKSECDKLQEEIDRLKNKLFEL